MPIIQVDVPEDMFREVQLRADAAGSGSVGEYLSGILLTSNVADTYVRGEIDNKIRQGLDSLRAGRGIDGDVFFDMMDAELKQTSG